MIRSGGLAIPLTFARVLAGGASVQQKARQ